MLWFNKKNKINKHEVFFLSDKKFIILMLVISAVSVLIAFILEIFLSAS